MRQGIEVHTRRRMHGIPHVRGTDNNTERMEAGRAKSVESVGILRGDGWDWGELVE